MEKSLPDVGNNKQLELDDKYFPSTPYNGYSIVDGLNAISVDSSFAYRTQIAAKNGIDVYVGNPNQNLHMLNLLKLGKLLRP